MLWIRNALYLVAAVVAVIPLLVRYVRTGKRVANLWTKLTGRVRYTPAATRPIWIHAVSVGEVLQTRPLIDALRRRDPSQPIVLSVSTASGWKLARERFSDCQVVPFPFDFSWAVGTALQRVNPRAVVLIELELWPNFLAVAAARSIPVSVISGRLSERSFAGYSRVRPIIGPMLRSLSTIAVQTESYRDRFIALGAAADAVRVTGSLKHDCLPAGRGGPAVHSLRRELGIGSGEVVLVAGSTHETEEVAVLQAYRQMIRDGVIVRLVVVPRHPERFDSVCQDIEQTGISCCRRSHGRLAATGEIILLDTVGELATCWQLADIAFVGGSLTQRGGQNMLEPAATGAAVLFGPNVWNFPRESSGLLASGGAISVADASELASEFGYLAQHPQRRAELARGAEMFVRTLSGCAEQAARELLPDAESARKAA